MRIFFTGGSGKAGRHVVTYLAEQGHQVTNADVVPLRHPAVADLRIDLTDIGEDILGAGRAGEDGGAAQSGVQQPVRSWWASSRSGARRRRGRGRARHGRRRVLRDQVGQRMSGEADHVMPACPVRGIRVLPTGGAGRRPSVTGDHPDAVVGAVRDQVIQARRRSPPHVRPPGTSPSPGATVAGTLTSGASSPPTRRGRTLLATKLS